MHHLFKITDSALLNSNAINDSEENETNYYNSVATIVSFTQAVFFDALIVPFALGLSGVSYMGYNFNPSEIKRGLPAIVLLHCSGFNETEFAVARYFLNNENYGSIISFNMEGYFNLKPDPEIGIETLAGGVVRATFKKIVEITGCNELIPIGHSIGGMVATEYAENTSEKDNIIIEHVFTVGSPLEGTPTLDFIWSKFGKNIKNTKRNHQMCRSSHFWRELSEKALKSEKEKKRIYYNIYSESDWAVPFESGKLTQNPDCILAYKYAGHYSLIVLPDTWNWVMLKLDAIYNQNISSKELVALPSNWNWVTSKVEDISQQNEI